MIMHMQYALMIGISTGAVIFATCVWAWYYWRFLKIMNANFDRLDHTMIAAIDKHSVPLGRR